MPVEPQRPSSSPACERSLLARREAQLGPTPLGASGQIDLPVAPRPQLSPRYSAPRSAASDSIASSYSMAPGSRADSPSDAARLSRPPYRRHLARPSGLLGLPATPQPTHSERDLFASSAANLFAPKSAGATERALSPRPLSPSVPVSPTQEPTYPPPPLSSSQGSARAQPQIPWPGRRFADGIVRRAPVGFFAMNVVGSYLYLLGGTALQRGIYATRPVIDPPSGAPMGPRPPMGTDPYDRPRPDLLGFFGSPAVAKGLGSAAIAVGVSMALFAFQRYWADGCAAVRGKNLPRSARWRPHIFLGVQAVCTGLAIYFRAFYLEALRDHMQTRAIWGPVAVGSVASGVFAAIQAQAFSSSEMLRGPFIEEHRNDVARVARTLYGVGLRALGHVVGIPSADVSSRQALRIATFGCLSAAYAMPLTLVRLNPSAMQAQPGAYHDDEVSTTSRVLRGRLPGHAVPPLLLAIYMVGQLLGGLFTVPISRLAEDNQVGRPPPPSDAAMQGRFIAAVVGVVIGITVEIAASTLLWRDARRHARMVEQKAQQLPDPPKVRPMRLINAFYVGAVVSSLCLLVGRILTETAKRPLPRAQEGISLALGAASISLQQLCVPELYAFSQVVRGRPNFPYMQDALLASRYFGSVLADVWVVASNVPVFQAFGRDALLVGSNFGTLIGLGVPTGVAYHEDARAFGQAVDVFLADQSVAERFPTQGRRGSTMSWVQDVLA